MIATNYPAKVQPAFNPMLLSIEQGEESTAKIMVAVQGQTFIGYFFLEKEFLTDNVSFDLSKLLRKYFVDALNERAGGVFPIYIDYNLMVSYWVYADGQVEITEVHGDSILTNVEPVNRALNAVRQLTQSTDLTELQWKFLTKNKKIKLYNGYSPFVSFLSGLTTNGKLLHVNDSRNLILDSLINSESNQYGFAIRHVNLQAGGEYVLSINGNTANAQNGKYLRVFIHKLDWSFIKYVDINSAANVTNSIKFTIPETIQYTISAYYHDETEPRTGTIRLNWYKLERVIQPTDKSTFWTPAPEDNPTIISDALYSLSVPLSNITAQSVLDNDNYKLSSLELYNNLGTLTDILYIDSIDCIPKNPFFLMWINQSGGWDNWMFSQRQVFSYGLTDVESFEPVIEDTQVSSSTNKTIGITGVDKVTVGAENLSSQDYEELRKIIYSPLIKWYNENLNDWVHIHIDPKELIKDNKYPKSEIELTFILPEPQLQF